MKGELLYLGINKYLHTSIDTVRHGTAWSKKETCLQKDVGGGPDSSLPRDLLNILPSSPFTTINHHHHTQINALT